MTIIYIYNNVYFHYEIIETLIVKYNEIIKKKIINPIIYLDIKQNNSFTSYINNKYKNIIFGKPNTYDYFISATIYQHDFNKIRHNSNTHYYISHEISLQLETLSNVCFLTPLSKNFIYADILPFPENKTVSNIPIYIIQGNLNQNRRYLNLLTRILDHIYKHKFIIKLVGQGTLPTQLEKYKNKIVLKNNLNFIDFHKEFLNSYCILPLISKKTHPNYYYKKLTSTINYARGYKLKTLIDKDLQDIYKLEDVEIYNDINDISNCFKKTLDDFYSSNRVI